MSIYCILLSIRNKNNNIVNTTKEIVLDNLETALDVVAKFKTKAYEAINSKIVSSIGIYVFIPEQHFTGLLFTDNPRKQDCIFTYTWSSPSVITPCR